MSQQDLTMTIFHSNTVFLITIPIVSALIGYVTNYIAVAMLFRPHKPLWVLGLRLQGLVPRRQSEIARSLGAMIERDLFSQEDIQAALKGSDTLDEALAFLDEQLERFIERLSAQNPMVGMFIQGPLLEQVKGLLREQIAGGFPELIERVVERASSKLDVSEIVRSKVEGFDLTKLEAIIHEVSARELKTIEVLGGVLGFIVGCVQVAIMVVVG
jgi:uncharacterized membrane protein YheB (UPF0754 family)